MCIHLSINLAYCEVILKATTSNLRRRVLADAEDIALLEELRTKAELMPKQHME